MQDKHPQTESAPGLVDSLSSLARNALGLLLTRLELAAIELGEVRAHLFKLLMFAALGAVAAGFALAWWCVLLVVLAWDSMGWTIIAIMGAVFSLLAVVLLRRVLAMLREDRLSMPATLAELRHDRDALM